MSSPQSLGEALPQEMARVLRDVLPRRMRSADAADKAACGFMLLALAQACDAIAEQNIPAMFASLFALRTYLD